MSVLDASLEFSDAQAQAASSAAVTQSTNVVDLWGATANPQEDGWNATKLPELGWSAWNANINVTVNATTVITAKLMTHSAATSIKSGTEVAQIVFAAAAAAGTKKSFIIPPGTEIATRYLGVTYTVSGAKCTAGAIDSYLSLDNEKYD
jgi:hypothetical protein